VGLLELFVAVLVAGISLVNAAIPLGAYTRLRDVRFLLLATGNALFAALGAVWIWGQLPVGPPGYASAALPVLLLALGVASFLLVSSLWSRRT
jgi:hypothetical protein